MMNKLESKNYSRATVTTRVWYLCKENEINPLNTKENPEIIIKAVHWYLENRENE